MQNLMGLHSVTMILAVIKKLLLLASTLVLISLAVFFVFQVLPGDPAMIILGPEADPSQLAALSESLGLNLPFHERYLQWVLSAIKGDFGVSLRYNMPVSGLIGSRLPVTAALTLMAVSMSAFFGIFFGVVISRYSNSAFGRALSMITQLGIAIPSFWMGMILALVFGLVLRLFPTGGFVPFNESVRGALLSLFLPALALSVGNSAVIVRFLKNTIAENMEMDYVRTARSRGLGENKVLFRHVLRNAFLPVVTILGMIITDTLSGSIIIENVFALPGLGQLVLSAISARDLPLMQALAVYIGFIVVVVNFAVDLVYMLVDPRIKNSGVEDA